MNGEARGSSAHQRWSPFFQAPRPPLDAAQRACPGALPREQMRVYAPNRIMGAGQWPPPTPLQCCHLPERPKKHAPAQVPGGGLVNRQSQSPIHHSTTVTLTPPRDRPSLLTHAGTIPLCFHRLSPWQSPECGSLGIVLSSLTGLSEESMLLLCDDDSPRDQTDRLEGAPLFPSPDRDRFHVLVLVLVVDIDRQPRSSSPPPPSRIALPPAVAAPCELTTTLRQARPRSSISSTARRPAVPYEQGPSIPRWPWPTKGVPALHKVVAPGPVLDSLSIPNPQTAPAPAGGQTRLQHASIPCPSHGRLTSLCR